VGNEPDAFFDDVQPASVEGKSWSDALVGFLAAARTRVHAQAPEIAVSMTLRQGSLSKGFDLHTLIAAGDVAVFNYYCQGVDYQVEPAGAVAGQVAQMVAAADGRPVVFQELGCPAGNTPSQLAASDEKQAAFLAAVTDEMAVQPTLRAAFVFQLVDWSPTLSGQYGQAYRDLGYPALGDQIEETLSSIGLLHFANGTPRLAWSTFLGALSELEN
jgi:hypothetical protein